ncbi:MAG: oxygen-independent coproporphyrinogen III oxidase [Arenimonas sp.]|nr:oxygen-independent coproporphyrinogen III oxidase [Arenimonas sp.]MBP7917239.1 oxygen-independent coproporphyrinogen III oxidase [Arenimonas sp.]
MNPRTEFNVELVKRYDGVGPRYTSYPTAPQFSPQFDGKAFINAIKDSNQDPIPRALSLYAHIPFCFSPCFYCGCNRIITRDEAKKQAYLEHLLKEIELIAPYFDSDREVVQLHLGGGTPNSLNTGQLEQLVRKFSESFRFAPENEREFSIEIDPRTVSTGDVAALRAMGFNRVSLGIQDFDADVQQAINRHQDIEKITDIFEACTSNGFHSINFDLIYGLPMQNLEGFRKTLETVSRLRPDRIALYSYAHMPELFKAQNRINVLTLPNPALKLELFQTAVEFLIGHGYAYIGMDHFALPDDELSVAQRNGDLHRNFMGYTTRKQTDLVGFGLSSISQIADSFSQNAKDLATWTQRIESATPATVRGMNTTCDDRIRAEVIQQIMCQGQVRFKDIEHRFELDFADYFRDELGRFAELIQDGLVALDAERLLVLPSGRLLLRVIASRFDAYLSKSQTRAIALPKAL